MPKEGIYTIQKFLNEPGFSLTILAQNIQQGISEGNFESEGYCIMHEHIGSDSSYNRAYNNSNGRVMEVDKVRYFKHSSEYMGSDTHEQVDLPYSQYNCVRRENHAANHLLRELAD